MEKKEIREILFIAMTSYYESIIDDKTIEVLLEYLKSNILVVNAHNKSSFENAITLTETLCDLDKSFTDNIYILYSGKELESGKTNFIYLRTFKGNAICYEKINPAIKKRTEDEEAFWMDKEYGIKELLDYFEQNQENIGEMYAFGNESDFKLISTIKALGGSIEYINPDEAPRKDLKSFIYGNSFIMK